MHGKKFGTVAAPARNTVALNSQAAARPMHKSHRMTAFLGMLQSQCGTNAPPNPRDSSSLTLYLRFRTAAIPKVALLPR